MMTSSPTSLLPSPDSGELLYKVDAGHNAVLGSLHVFGATVVVHPRVHA